MDDVIKGSDNFKDYTDDQVQLKLSKKIKKYRKEFISRALFKQNGFLAKANVSDLKYEEDETSPTCKIDNSSKLDYFSFDGLE